MTLQGFTKKTDRHFFKQQKDITVFHEHPLRILRYSLKNIWLLIFPFLRGVSVMHFDPAGVYAWIRGAWMDIAVLGVILIYGLIRWHCSRIEITEKYLIHTEGFIVKIKRTIPFDRISSAASETPFYLVPFRAVNVRCDTRAGILNSTDLKIMVTPHAEKAIMSRIPDINKEEAYKFPNPGMLSVLLFSVFFSSGFSGTVYIAAFFIKGGDIAYDITKIAMSRITEQAEHIYTKLLSGIPKAAAIAAAFFIAAWLLSFIMNVQRYFRFMLSADNECINVSFGLIKRRHHRLKPMHMNYIDLRQNLLMKFGHVLTVNISCPGYGYSSHLPVLIPIIRENELRKIPWKQAANINTIPKYRPEWTSFFKYAGLPFIGVILVTLLYGISDKVPHLADLSLFIVIMGDIPLAWLTMVKTTALLTSGISLKDDLIVIRSSKWTSFHTVIAHPENVVMVQIRQTLFQKPFNKCDVIIWLCGESSSRYKVNALTLKQGKEIEEKINLMHNAF